MADQPSRARPWSAPEQPKGPAVQVAELKDLVVAYAKQETVDPLRNLGWYLFYGLAGAVSIATGIIFGLLALLRALQELPALNRPRLVNGVVVAEHRLSFAPYLIVVAVGAIVAGFFVSRIYRMIFPKGSS